MSSDASMLACFYASFGGPEVDEVGELPRPREEDLAPGQVLLKMRASSLNPADYKQRSGKHAAILSIKLPQVYGFDFCGTVVASRSGEWAAGDEVFGMCKGLRRGGLAEFFIVDGDICVARDPKMSSIDAASLPLVGITALKAFAKCRLLPAHERDASRPAPRVLVLGGAGGVGTVAIQLAKGFYGASHVATTASAGAKTELVRQLGADQVVNYRESNFWQVLASASDTDLFDAILDCTGEAAKCPPLLREGGGLVSITAAPTVTALREFIDESDTRSFHKITFGVDGFLHSGLGGAIFDRLTGAASLDAKCRKRGGGTFAHIIGTGNRRDVKVLAAEYAAGRLRAVIDHVYPLRDSLDALKRIESGRAQGKVVIAIADTEASATSEIAETPTAKDGDEP